jgi:hypothetical protein
MSIPTARELQLKTLRDGIEELKAQCTHEQLAMLQKVFPGGIKPEQCADAYELLRRTVLKNLAGRS